MRGRLSSDNFEIRRKIFPGVAKNLHDGLSILKCEPPVARRSILAREDLPHAREDGVASRLRQLIELRRVDEIAAGVSKDPAFQVEIAQRPATAISRSLRCEPFGVCRGPHNRAGERRLVDEEEVVDHFAGRVLKRNGRFGVFHV